jgi:dTDP-4-amino-4,6-dideoxygalactose transaminase
MTDNDWIQFVNLGPQHEGIRNEIDAVIRDIIDHSSFTGGSYVSNFEQEFASYLGVREVVAVANGTDAIWLALLAAKIGSKDAVITVPNTFIGTVEAITRTGAYPLLVDIDLATFHMDVHALQRFLNGKCIRLDDGRVIHRRTGRRVAAILPVHLYGLSVEMGKLLEIAELFDLPVIEEASHAHGAQYRLNGEWKKVGTMGLAAGFSFYPVKNLGAMGDGGAVATNDSELALRLRWLRNHGSSEKYIHLFPEGWTSKLDSMQAAILSIKLKHLDKWNASRREVAGHYRKALTGLPLDLPFEPENTKHVYHHFVIRTPHREDLRRELTRRGIGVGIHYPIPLHLQQAYQSFGLRPGSLPYSELSAKTVLSLPMYPGLKTDQVERIGQAFDEILQKSIDCGKGVY